MTDETTQLTSKEETIGEVGQPTETPDDSAQEPSLDTQIEDKADEEPTEDTTFDPSEAVQENFLGTFKTKEDADKGFKDAQSKITEQGNRIKALEAELKNSTQAAMPYDKRVAALNEQLDYEYLNTIQQVTAKLLQDYNQAKASIGNNPQAQANLELQVFSNLLAEVTALSNDFRSKREDGKLAIEQESQKSDAECRAKDLARFPQGKTAEMIVNAWYDTHESIDDIAKIFSDYKALVIEDYIKEQAALKEDTNHKGKLATNADSSNKPQYGDNHIFTLKELAAMSDEEFAKYEAIIDDQVARKLVK